MGRIVRYVFGGLLLAHASLCIFNSSRGALLRARFVRWWVESDEPLRTRHIFAPETTDLIQHCLNTIPEHDSVLVKTDFEPWLVNYYLYPRQLYQETTTPEAGVAIAPLSPRQRAYPVRKDIRVRWVVLDLRGEDGMRIQRVLRADGGGAPPGMGVQD